MDIPLVGGNFTWSNSQDHPSWSRIDMFLLSPNWEAQFPSVSRRSSLGCYQITFLYCSSDCGGVIKSRRYFKFENMSLKL
jgi:hypothetical protein